MAKSVPEIPSQVSSPYLINLIESGRFLIPHYEEVSVNAQWFMSPYLSQKIEPINFSLPFILRDHRKSLIFMCELLWKLETIQYPEYIMVYAEGPEKTYEILRETDVHNDAQYDRNIELYLDRIYIDIIEMIEIHAPLFKNYAKEKERLTLDQIKKILQSWMPTAENWEPYVEMAHHCMVAPMVHFRFMKFQCRPEVVFFKALLAEGHSMETVTEAFRKCKRGKLFQFPSLDWYEIEWQYHLAIVRDRINRSDDSDDSDYFDDFDY